MSKIAWIVGDTYEFNNCINRKLVHISSRSGELVFEGSMGCLYITTEAGQETAKGTGNVTRRIPPKVVRYAVMSHDNVVTTCATEAQAQGFAAARYSHTRIVKLVEERS